MVQAYQNCEALNTRFKESLASRLVGLSRPNPLLWPRSFAPQSQAMCIDGINVFELKATLFSPSMMSSASKYSLDSLRLPADLVAQCRRYDEFRTLAFSAPTKRQWLVDQGSAVVTLHSLSGSYDALVSTVQMVVLALFNDADDLTLNRMQELTGASIGDLQEALLSLCADKHPLLHQSDSMYMLNDSWQPVASDMVQNIVVVHRVMALNAAGSEMARMDAGLEQQRQHVKLSADARQSKHNMSPMQMSADHLTRADGIVAAHLTKLQQTASAVEALKLLNQAAPKQAPLSLSLQYSDDVDHGEFDNQSDMLASCMLPGLQYTPGITDPAWLFSRSQPLGENWWTAEQVQDLLNQTIFHISSHLRIQSGQAELLLVTNDWNVDRLMARYNSDVGICFEEAGLPARDAQGIMPRQFQRGVASDADQFCSLCLDTVPSVKMASLWCGHWACTSCWGDWMLTFKSIKTACCIEHGNGCAATIPMEFVAAAEFKSQASIRNTHRLQSYLEQHSADLSQCQSAMCGAVGLYSLADGGSPTVSSSPPAAPDALKTSKLSDYRRCAICHFEKCAEVCVFPSHSPAPCRAIEWWVADEGFYDSSGNADPSQLMLMMTSKPCPKCQRRIQKASGCKHMTCVCKHEWCWVCFKEIKSLGGCACESYPDRQTGSDNAPVDYAQLLEAFTNKTALPRMSASIAMVSLPRIAPLTGITVDERKPLVLQINNRIAHYVFGRDFASACQQRCQQAVAEGQLDAAQVECIRNLERACVAVMDARNVLIRCIICEYYSPYMSIRVRAPTADAAVDSEASPEISGDSALSLFIYMARDLEKQAETTQALIEQVTQQTVSDRMSLPLSVFLSSSSPLPFPPLFISFVFKISLPHVQSRRYPSKHCVWSKSSRRFWRCFNRRL